MSDRTPLWLFGYGSLIWRPAFAFAERRVAAVAGWERRFYQGSTDHRGVPEAPGRVVTLLPASAGRCVGVAYRVADAEAEAVLAALDHREQGGYVRVDLRAELLGPDAAEVAAVTWVAGPENPHWLGEAALSEIARQIERSRGPSGENREYLLRLAAALRELETDDPHVFELEREVLALTTAAGLR